MPQASTSRLDSLRSNIALANGQVDMMLVLVSRAQATMPSKRRRPPCLPCSELGNVCFDQRVGECVESLVLAAAGLLLFERLESSGHLFFDGFW